MRLHCTTWWRQKLSFIFIKSFVLTKKTLSKALLPQNNINFKSYEIASFEIQKFLWTNYSQATKWWIFNVRQNLISWKECYLATLFWIVHRSILKRTTQPPHVQLVYTGILIHEWFFSITWQHFSFKLSNSAAKMLGYVVYMFWNIMKITC